MAGRLGLEGVEGAAFHADEQAAPCGHQARLGQTPPPLHRQGRVLVAARQGAGHGGVVAAGVGAGLVLALQQDDSPLAGAGEVEGEAEPRDAAADDCNLCRVNRAHASILAPLPAGAASGAGPAPVPCDLGQGFRVATWVEGL